MLCGPARSDWKVMPRRTRLLYGTLPPVVDFALGWVVVVVVASALLTALVRLFIRRTSYILELRGRRLALFITLGRGQFRIYFHRIWDNHSPRNAGIFFTRERRFIPFRPDQSP